MNVETNNKGASEELMLQQIRALRADALERERGRELAKYDTMHILHFLISCFTTGIWVLVWLFCALSNNSNRDRINKKYDYKKYAIYYGAAEDSTIEKNDDESSQSLADNLFIKFIIIGSMILLVFMSSVTLYDYLVRQTL